MSEQDDIWADLEDRTPLPTNEEQEELAENVRLLKQVQRQKEKVEKRLKDLKEEERRLSMERIPSIMESTGLTELKTKDGDSVSIKDVIQATIPKRSEERAFQWLEENGAGDLIKADLVSHFNREELEKAREIAKKVEEQFGLSVEVAQKVHPQTLSAFVREQLKESGEVPPDDIFNIFIGRKAVIK